MFEDKSRPVKKNNLRLRFARGRCVPGACCRRRRLRLSSPPPPMGVDDVRLRVRKRDWLCNGTHQRQQKQAQGNPLTYGKPKETPDPIPYPCLGGTFFLLLGQGMDPKEMTTFCHATRCHTLGVIIWPSNRKKFGPTTRCLDLSCLVLCLLLLPLPPPFLSFFISYLSAFYLIWVIVERNNSNKVERREISNRKNRNGGGGGEKYKRQDPFLILFLFILFMLPYSLVVESVCVIHEHHG